ncbi:ArgP/LysG family DNA-binding transcriptional regulator [Alteromonas sp. McT4-15]|uniref:ArgP/LysG family DNA-binding transcriptional regulator n=1 Tax=unclassified Alteromonas TaxID=2614992 RepID=UPI001924970D|nr:MULTISPECIES: ArgP/LysG family DNA-binding transcriptional regulator [unclassified Alteromonas]MCB4435667.1 ArgP/LysG family DNA-binding transcriptional regulator [Alteromonas sp. McT4-15]BCO17288.1 HTH-type transcriptional regulator ArgP [Alteromonas sp. KC3]BCO21277.1 HTH-type transcriptional regulator ArgP [Alteromonas sp. KC14]
MLDYDALRCFHEVLRYGGFEKGAQALSLTQSAVSQKIKRLEQSVGGPVLVRTKPLRPTPLGNELLAHIQKVSVLEEALNIQSGLTASAAPLSVAVNNDVLATWFSQVLAKFSDTRANPVHIVNADQTQTRDILQQGRVMACISQTGTPVTGGQSLRLGTMKYQLYASPRFIERYLSKGIDAEAVMQTPGLLYDEYDVTLLTDYQRECLNMAPSFTTCHWYPSSHGFVKMALDGVVWALLPTLQVTQEVNEGSLVSLFPDKELGVPLFWHWITLDSAALGDLTKAVKHVAKQQLK